MSVSYRGYLLTVLTYYSNVFVCDCTIKNKTTLSALSFGEKRETVIRDFNECDIIPPWAIAPLIKIVLIRREKKILLVNLTPCQMRAGLNRHPTQFSYLHPLKTLTLYQEPATVIHLRYCQHICFIQRMMLIK